MNVLFLTTVNGKSKIINDMTQIATSIEQSKRLLELRLSPDTADMINMCYSYSFNGKEYTDCKYKLRLLEEGEEPFMPELNIPSWSLTALLKLMPYNQLEGYNNKWSLWVWDDTGYALHVEQGYESPIDAAYHMAVWLLENGHIKTEKI